MIKLFPFFTFYFTSLIIVRYWFKYIRVFDCERFMQDSLDELNTNKNQTPI